jgi:hypothetical protein
VTQAGVFFIIKSQEKHNSKRNQAVIIRSGRSGSFEECMRMSDIEMYKEKKAKKAKKVGR